MDGTKDSSQFHSLRYQDVPISPALYLLSKRGAAEHRLISDGQISPRKAVTLLCFCPPRDSNQRTSVASLKVSVCPSTYCAPQCFTEQASEISTAAWNLPFRPAPVAAPASSAFRQTQSILLCVPVPRNPPPPERSSPGLAIKCQEEPPKCITRFPQPPPCGVLFLLHLVEWNG